MSIKIYKAIIIAHYHKLGKIRKDTLDSISYFKKYFDRIILVSTNLKKKEQYKIPKKVQIFTRKNFGYDFYSYRYGIIRLIKEKLNYQITLMNTSFIIIDPKKLYNQYINNGIKKKKFDFYGITQSNEIQKHIQSYLMTFSSGLSKDKKFISWWKKMTPLNSRNKVINKYEIGLSKFIINLGYKMKSSFIYWKFFNKIKNPTHAKYKKLLNKYGILKIEVIKTNPFKLNLDYIKKLINNNNLIKAKIKEGLNN